MLLKLAWRNLWRHRTRTLIMASAVALAYALMLVGIALGDDSHDRMLVMAAEAAGGDVLVHGDGYWDSRASDIVIPDGDAVLDRVRRVDGVAAAFPRILINGLVSTSADNTPVLLQGIDPDVETALHDYPEDIVAGAWLDGGRADPLILGVRAADRLELEVGDRVVLTASDPSGEVTRALFHLVGVIESGTRQLDEVLALTTVAAAREALGAGPILTQVGVLAADDGRVAQLAAAVRDAVDAASPANAAGAGLEVLTWEEAVPEMVGLIEIDEAFGYVYFAIIFAVVLFSITNTFLMAVMERVREFGLLNALGLRNERIGRLLLTETVLLAALAMAVGFVLALGGHLAVDHWGISMAAYGVEEIEMSGIDMADLVVYSRIDATKWGVASLLVAVSTVASALYPAWRAARLAPAEAMRFYE